MPTQGVLGFYLEGRWYVMFNQFDSYPRGLGNNILKDLKKSHHNGSFKKWKNQVPFLKFIDPNVKPTPEEILKYAPYTNLKHHSRSTEDWACVLYKAKTLSNCLRAGCMINHIDAEGKPKWEQYAYIINFDTEKIDYYYMKGQLLESREFTDIDRPFPEADEILRPPSNNATSGTSSGPSVSSGSSNTSTAKFSSLISSHWNSLRNLVLVTYVSSFGNGSPWSMNRETRMTAVVPRSVTSLRIQGPQRTALLGNSFRSFSRLFAMRSPLRFALI